ncbi:hypothetical protein RchiOBHm_Chr5g0075631 [Rosa chinensis]|uniref:Uncharacterized protein n=1 Tax=Rosa chinensis TaxID=74649 RepID=A0A2P6QLI0_ROSCH|nr:hypothetical protein RchiOBHm_Chr5g0075631 [Rosa chinensis]
MRLKCDGIACSMATDGKDIVPLPTAPVEPDPSVPIGPTAPTSAHPHRALFSLRRLICY